MQKNIFKHTFCSTKLSSRAYEIRRPIWTELILHFNIQRRVIVITFFPNPQPICFKNCASWKWNNSILKLTHVAETACRKWQNFPPTMRAECSFRMLSTACRVDVPLQNNMKILFCAKLNSISISNRAKLDMISMAGIGSVFPESNTTL